MHKRILSLCLSAALLFSLVLGLTGCSGSAETDYCFGIVSDGNALSDDHQIHIVEKLSQHICHGVVVCC